MKDIRKLSISLVAVILMPILISPSAFAVTPPFANFTSDITEGYPPLNVTFTDQSIGSPTSWTWYFGDGITSNLQNPSHIYTQAGNYTVTLLVSNTVGINSFTKSNSIIVTALPSPNFIQKSTPTITWNNPIDISYGTALRSTQLNAVASVPGNFYYNPPVGTVLNAGTRTLHVDFIPTDTLNYNTASRDVTINVGPDPLNDLSSFPTSRETPLNVPLFNKSNRLYDKSERVFGDDKPSESQIPNDYNVHEYQKNWKTRGHFNSETHGHFNSETHGHSRGEE